MKIKKIYKLSAFFLSLLIIISCSKEKKDPYSYDLIPVQKDKKWGYIDKTGNFVINPQFNMAYLFSDGLAVVQSPDDKYGYIDKKGQYVINPIYKDVTVFTEGLAGVTAENAYPAFIDTKGKIKFTVKADEVYYFKEGLALAKVDDKYGFIDKKGEFAIKPQFEDANQFCEGLAAIAMKKGKDADSLVWGFIDKSGKIVIQPQYKEVGVFSEGKAYCQVGDKYGFIDKSGKYVINPQYENVTNFVDGLAAIKQGEVWGFIDPSGKMIINPQFEALLVFHDGMASVRSGEENWGYIDKKGKYVINPQFNAASRFYGDMAAVLVGDKIGFIDKKGKYLINPQFDDVFCYFSYYSMFFDLNYYYSAKSDYFDVNKVADKFLEFKGDNQFRDISSSTTYMDVANLKSKKQEKEDNPADITNNEISNVSTDNSELSDEDEYTAKRYSSEDITDYVTIQSTAYTFKEPYYKWISDYSYGWYSGDSKKYINSAKIGDVEYSLGLKESSPAYNKGKLLATSIKDILINKYRGSDKGESFAPKDIAAADSSYLADKPKNDKTSGCYHVYLKNMSFRIDYTENEVIVKVRYPKEKEI